MGPIMPNHAADHLEGRMLSVENALARIINYIEQNTTTPISEQ